MERKNFLNIQLDFILSELWKQFSKKYYKQQV
jgi:hypothetical protein